MRTLVLAISGLTAAFLPEPLQAQVQGMVVLPFKTDSTTYGTVGQLVRFSERGSEIVLELPSGRVAVQPWEGNVVPADPDFTPAYILSAFRACASQCRARDVDRGETQDEVAHRLLRLVERVLEVFPDYSDISEFRALECDLRRPLDTKEDLSPAIDCAEQFVREYPGHRRADEMEYRAISMRNDVYEFEGSVEQMRTQADALERFLTDHPQNGFADQARLRVARLYYMMYESSPPGAPRERFRSRALELYDRLVDSPEESARLTAHILRFNLEQGRSIYINPNAWTRAF